MKNETRYKIAVFGANNAGKTSLINRYTKKKFSESYLDNFGEDFQDGPPNRNKVSLQLWDLAPSNAIDLLKSNYTHSETKAYLIVFDPSEENALAKVAYQMQEINSYISHSTPVIMVSTKVDLESAFVNNQMATFEAASLAELYYKNVSYFGATSAKTGANVDNLFEEVIEKIQLDCLQSCNAANSKKASKSYRDYDKTTEEGCLTAFRTAHRARVKKECFKFFRRTAINYTEDLPFILEHAQIKDNRSRKVCVELKWMTPDGNLRGSAPEPVKQNYSAINKSIVLFNSQ